MAGYAARLLQKTDIRTLQTRDGALDGALNRIRLLKLQGWVVDRLRLSAGLQQKIHNRRVAMQFRQIERRITVDVFGVDVGSMIDQQFDGIQRKQVGIGGE